MDHGSDDEETLALPKLRSAVKEKTFEQFWDDVGHTLLAIWEDLGERLVLLGVATTSTAFVQWCYDHSR